MQDYVTDVRVSFQSIAIESERIRLIRALFLKKNLLKINTALYKSCIVLKIGEILKVAQQNTKNLEQKVLFIDINRHGW